MRTSLPPNLDSAVRNFLYARILNGCSFLRAVQPSFVVANSLVLEPVHKTDGEDIVVEGSRQVPAPMWPVLAQGYGHVPARQRPRVGVRMERQLCDDASCGDDLRRDGLAHGRLHTPCDCTLKPVRMRRNESHTRRQRSSLCERKRLLWCTGPSGVGVHAVPPHRARGAQALRRVRHQRSAAHAHAIPHQLPERAIGRSALVTQCYRYSVPPVAKALRASRSDKQSYATARRRYSIFTHQCKPLDAIAKHRKSSRRFCT